MGRPNLYEWDTIFAELEADGSRLFTAGADYRVPCNSFRGGLLNEAKRRGVRLRTAKLRLGEQLLVTMDRQARYPWDHWMDGAEHVLVDGRDFSIHPEDMRRSARRVAKARGLYLHSEIKGDMLLIKASTEPGERGRPGGKHAPYLAAVERAEAELQREDDEFAAYDALTG